MAAASETARPCRALPLLCHERLLVKKILSFYFFEEQIVTVLLLAPC
jgi:hypothetical protein